MPFGFRWLKKFSKRFEITACNIVLINFSCHHFVELMCSSDPTALQKLHPYVSSLEIYQYPAESLRRMHAVNLGNKRQVMIKTNFSS